MFLKTKVKIYYILIAYYFWRRTYTYYKDNNEKAYQIFDKYCSQSAVYKSTQKLSLPLRERIVAYCG